MGVQIPFSFSIFENKLTGMLIYPVVNGNETNRKQKLIKQANKSKTW